MNKVTLGIFLLMAWLTACKDDDSTTPILFDGQEYLPLQVGQEAIYQIDSVLYNEFTGRVDTVSLQLREVVQERIVDAENREAFDIGVYQRASDSLAWQYLRLIRKTKTENRYELLDQNLITLPLVFPVSNNKQWDANRVNTLDEAEYQYEFVNERFTVSGVVFDSTLTVAQLDEENLIERQFAEEKYATQRGLIYRKHISLETELNGTIRSGFEATLRLIEFK